LRTPGVDCRIRPLRNESQSKNGAQRYVKRMAESRGDYLCECGTQCARRAGFARPSIYPRDLESREVAKLVLNSTLLRQQEQ